MSGLLTGLALLATTDAFAQQTMRQPYRTPTKSRSEIEQAARVRWQPTRKEPVPQTRETESQQGVRQAGHVTSGKIRRTQADLPAPIQPKPLPMGDVPLMDLGGEGYEVPNPPARSVLNSSPQQDYQPMDGEVIYDSQPYSGDVVSDTYGCDSMGCSGGPMCGRGSCDGGSCDGGSCDSMGGSCGCNSCQEGAFGRDAWRPCMTLCFPQNGWVSFDYLNWNQKGMSLPPLVTTSQLNTPQGNAGVLGVPSTTTLFGGNRVLDNGFSGGRLQFGFWLDKCHTWGIGAEYFDLQERSESFNSTSTGAIGSQILARPFFNIGNRVSNGVAETGEDAQLVAYPGVLRGSVSARATSDLVGAGFHIRHRTNCSTECARDYLCGGCTQVHSRVDWMFGYRYLQLDESVSVNENLTVLPQGTGSFVINDRFETRNTFNGVDLGVLYNRRKGVWSTDFLIKMAVGNTHQVVDIRGNTITNGVQQLPAGGLLAQQSNIGRHERDRFSVVPELGATLGYYVTPNFQLRAGYTVIYWSNVVRPGDQIDLDVNPAFLPPATGNITTSRRPGFKFQDSDYYVHGVNLGAQLTW